MQEKFLKELVVLLVGKHAEGIVDIMSKDKHVNEFLIAKKLDMEINQTRNILYRLSDHGLVSSTRKKDARKGWYTYFWRIERLKALHFLLDLYDKHLDQLGKQMNSRTTRRFYFCETCHREYTEENALLQEFTCPECGGVFVLRDNSKVVKDLGKQRSDLEKRGTLLREEYEKERTKDEKKRMRVIAKDLKAKKEARKKAAKKAAKKRAETVAAKKQAAANSASKTVAKKKTVKKATKKTVKKTSSKKRKK